MESLYTLEQFVDLVNDSLQEKAAELRAKGFIIEEPWRPVTDRQVRDYRTKGVTTEALKQGREVRYTQAHVDEMVELKVAQKTGITSRAYESLKKHLGSSEMLAGDTGAVSGHACASAEGAPASVQDEGARLRLAGLTYLSSLGGTAETALASRLVRSPPGLTIGGASGVFAVAAGQASCVGDGKPPQVSSEREQTAAKSVAMTWREWEPLPGVRVQVRGDVLASWGPHETAALTEFFRDFSSKDN